MSQLVRSSKKNPEIRQLALSLVRRNGQKDWVGEVRDLHAFVRDRIRYVKDIRGVETLHTPEKLLEYGQGDCDDKSTLLATLLETLGHPTRFVAVGFRPGRFDHVYVETKIGPRWIGLESTEPWPPGKVPPGAVTRMEQNN
jgi:transglutaminase-like putative cysteine protease